MSLLPVLLLLTAFLVGSLRISQKAQDRIALQARLDVCAVRLAAIRERSLGKLSRANAGLAASALGIYAARGLKIAGPVGAATGGAGEAALLQVNRSLAAFQKTVLATGSVAGFDCAPTKHSRDPVFCLASPPLAQGLTRERALFPDVNGVLVHKKPGRSLARLSCTGQNGLTTRLEVRGDPRLVSPEFHDVYLR